MANVDNLMIVRLITGEEVLGEITIQDDKIIQIKNPVRIVVVPSKTDPKNPSVGFAPYMQWSDDKELTLNQSCVITMATPMTEFVNQYNGMFGGLVVPNSGLIKP